MNQKNQALMEQFQQYLTEAEKSPITIEKYLRDVTAFLNWCNAKKLTKSLVLEYKKMLLERYAISSANSILSSLNSFFLWQNLAHLKTKNIRLQNRSFFDHCTELTKSEYNRLLSAASEKKNPRLFYLLQTICSTEMRVSEDI